MSTTLSTARKLAVDLGAFLQEIKLTLVSKTMGLPPTIRTGIDVVRFVLPHVLGLHREAFFVVPLNGRHRPLGIHMVSLGTPTNSVVHPREVFLPAVLSGATALIVAHNHPSGDPSPSPEDQEVTERLRAAGEILGVEMVDHLVLGGEQFYSFAGDDYHFIHE